MEKITSFLFAFVLTGLFALLARLVLPERFSSLARLVKALCALVLSLILLSPFFHLLADAQSALDQWAERFLTAPSNTENRDTDHEDLVGREVTRQIEADLNAYLDQTHPGFICTVEFCPGEGINRDTILIVYKQEGFPEQDAGDYIERRYGCAYRFERRPPEET